MQWSGAFVIFSAALVFTAKKMDTPQGTPIGGGIKLKQVNPDHWKCEVCGLTEVLMTQ